MTWTAPEIAIPDGSTAADEYGRLLEESRLADKIVANASLDETFTYDGEEYARHNGHADLLRERTDGATGA